MHEIKQSQPETQGRPSFNPTQAQRSRWKNQEKIVFAAFFQEPKTMYMVEKQTGIMRPSICRFVATWKKKDSIRVVRTAKDPFTKCTAQFLTTNPEYFPGAQVTMFASTLKSDDKH